MSYKDYAEDAEYEAGVMQESVDALSAGVVGHRVVAVDKVPYPRHLSDYYYGRGEAIRLTLDNGTRVYVADTDDCCAYTAVKDFEFLTYTDHAITSVVADEEFARWFIYADSIPVVALNVEWSPGNPYYYGFGFDILVEKEVIA